MKNKTILWILILGLLVSVASSKQLKDTVIIDYSIEEVIGYKDVCTSTGLYLNGTIKCLSYKTEPYVMYEQKIYSGDVFIDAIKISYEGFFCSYRGGFEIHCVSLTDGFHKGEPAYCNRYGGMTCKIIKLYDFDKYRLTETDGEIPETVMFKDKILK